MAYNWKAIAKNRQNQNIALIWLRLFVVPKLQDHHKLHCVRTFNSILFRNQKQKMNFSIDSIVHTRTIYCPISLARIPQTIIIIIKFKSMAKTKQNLQKYFTQNFTNEFLFFGVRHQRQQQVCCVRLAALSNCCFDSWNICLLPYTVQLIRRTVQTFQKFCHSAFRSQRLRRWWCSVSHYTYYTYRTQRMFTDFRTFFFAFAWILVEKNVYRMAKIKW